MPYQGDHGGYGQPPYHNSYQQQPRVVIPPPRQHDVQQDQRYQRSAEMQYMQMPQSQFQAGHHPPYSPNLQQQHYTPQQTVSAPDRGNFHPFQGHFQHSHQQNVANSHANSRQYQQQGRTHQRAEQARQFQFPRQQARPPQASQAPRRNQKTASNNMASHFQQPSRPPHAVTRASVPPSSANAVRQTPQALDVLMPAPPASHQRVAHVEIPLQRTSSNANMANTAASRAPKRRKSNDSDTIEVHHVPKRPVPQQTGASQRVKQQDILTPSPSTGLSSSQLPSTPHAPPNVDYQTVLLALSDEYVRAAYDLSAALSGHASEEEINEYYGLLSTAMGCLESALTNYRQPDAAKEARIRLRLATLLNHETENTQQAEEVLTKGIAVCDRSRLVDQKYAMHHLLIRVWAKSSPKAAMKAAEKLTAEVEALRNVHWFYAFRFLRVSLGLQFGGPADTANTLKHLMAISATANDFRHVSVLIVASSLEALSHLRSGGSDALDLAGRALAAARTHQLSTEMRSMPQVKAFIDSLDLMCALLACKFDQIDRKMEQMDESWDAGAKHANWGTDGVLLMPLGGEATPELENDTAGVLKSSASNEKALAFWWLSCQDRYSIRYLLHGIAQMHKAAHDEKATIWLKEGLKTIGLASDARPQSLAAQAASAAWLNTLCALMRLQLAFAYCARNEWSDAQKMLEELEADNPIFADGFSRALLLYLRATCKQALGDLKGAMALYRLPDLNYASDSKCSSALKDIQVLSTLNAVLIHHNQNTAGVPTQITEVEQHCVQHPNPSMWSAHSIVRASTEPQSGNTILKSKQYLSSASRGAKAANNHQLMAVSLNIMSSRYFQGIVVQQAQKSVKASRTVARRAGSVLWTAVAEKMFANTLEICGEAKEARIARATLQQSMAALPQSLRDALERDMSE